MSGRYDGNPMPKDYPRKEFYYVDQFGNRERATDRIQKKKEIKVVKKELPKDWKPKYLNGNVIDITPLIDDNWFEIFGEELPKEESRLLLVPKSKAEGIKSILSLHDKKFA